MNRALVLDASAAICWASPDESPPEELAAGIDTRQCIAPALWLYEVNNVLLIMGRRGRLDAATGAIMREALEALGVELEPATWPAVGGHAAVLARRHGLTVYDASYLELALRRGAVLASMDAKLREAAAREGVTVLP